MRKLSAFLLIALAAVTVLLSAAAQSAHAAGITMLYPPDGATNVPARRTEIILAGGSGSYNYTLSGNSEYGSSSSSGSISIIGANPSIERDLLPGTTYELRISSGYSSGTFSFTTADPANTTDPTGPAIDPLDPVETVKVSSVAIKPPELLLAVGEKETLELFIEPADAPDKSVIFASSNNSVATVDASGVVTAVAPGSAMITATANSARENAGNGACYVKVIKTRVPVSSVMLGYKELNLVVGDTVGLGYGIEPDGATDYSVSFASSNNSVATVDASGAVTAVAPGSATITATANDGGGASDSCSVTVQKAPIKAIGVGLDRSFITLIIGESAQLTANVLPYNATNKKVKWSTSNAKVTTVGGDGKVTATGAGNAVVTVMTEDGGFTAEANVEVSKIVPSIDALPKASAITEGSPLSASAITGGRVIDLSTGAVVKGTFTWNIPTLVPALADSGMNFDLRFRPANAAKYEGVAGAVPVEVKAAVVPVEGVKLDKSAYDIFVGKTAQAAATVIPADATDKKVLWSTSDNKIATIDASGKITGVAEGEAKIKAATADGDFAAEANVRVSKRPTSVTLKPAASAISEGSALKASALTGGTAVSDGAPVQGGFVWSAPEIVPLLADSLKTEYGVKFVPTDKNRYAESQAKVILEIKQTVFPVAGVAISAKTLELRANESAGLSAAVAPANATDKAVQWNTSNASVAKVDADGNVTALAEGTAEISVTTEDGGYTDSCAVTVLPSGEPVSGVNIENQKVRLNPGESAQLVATVLPAEAGNKKLLWKSADEKVATVDENGFVTAVGPGKTVISAVTEDGGFTAESVVYIGGGEGGGGGCDTGAGILLLTFTIPFIYRRKR